MVTFHQLLAPVGQLERLVDEQHLSALLHEPACEVHNAMGLEVEAVEVDVQALAQLYVKVLFGILKQERGASDAAGAFDANQPVAPVDGVHERAAYRGMEVLHQIGV